jgi:dihydrofolate reductase
MGKVIADQSMSLDGFSAGPNVAGGNPLGDGGERLHEWMFPADGAAGSGAEVREETLMYATNRTSGAVVMGRRMFDLGVEPWGDNPPFHMPVFVVTHNARNPLVKEGGTTYFFVTDGIEGALARARAAAGDKDIAVLGGANVIQQFIEAGLLDEVRLHLVHLLLGGGTRLFDRLGPAQVDLESNRVIESPGVTHLRFRVVTHKIGSRQA